MKIRGTHLLTVSLALSCFPYASCSEQKPAVDATQEAPPVAEPVIKAAPQVTQAPPKGYDGPVKGLYLDGTLLSQSFIPEKVIWEKSHLELRIGDEQWPEAAVRLAWTDADPYAVPFGTSLVVDAAHPPKKQFQVWCLYKITDTRAPKQKKIENAYTLEVRFDEDSGEGGMTGYIDLVCADPPVDIRGAFEAEFAGERTPYGIADPRMPSDANLSYLFDKRFKEKYPDQPFKILRVMDLRRNKTANKELRLGYAEFQLVLGESENTFRSALLIETPDAWECVEILEPYQIPEAFPVVQPQPPPDGDPQSYINFMIADHVQSSISTQMNVFNYKNVLSFGGQPISWVLGTVTYRTSTDSKAVTTREILVRNTELGWLIESEVLPGFKFDQMTGEIIPN